MLAKTRAKQSKCLVWSLPQLLELKPSAFSLITEQKVFDFSSVLFLILSSKTRVLVLYANALCSAVIKAGTETEVLVGMKNDGNEMVSYHTHNLKLAESF